MSKVEVLVATINQSDFTLFDKMNIQTDVLIANQSSTFSKVYTSINNCSVKMITTDQKGVGKNRNIALMFAASEICILSDDDVVFKKNYHEIISNAFEQVPNADILIFNVNMKNDNSYNRINTKVEKVNLFNFMNYGAVRIAFRREKILRNNIWFSTKFGGGAEFSSGEDSLFLREALRKKMNIYTIPECIADVKQDESTWFTGYNEKYFIDKGRFLAAAFPILKFVLAVHFSIKFSRITQKNFIKIFKLIHSGIKDYK